MKNTVFTRPVISRARHTAFIGQKGIPAEFPGTSGVEFYVEERARTLAAAGKTVTCYVRPWATDPSFRSYKGVRLVSLPTIRTKHLDAPVHSFLATLHAVFSDTDTIWYQASGPAIFGIIARAAGKRVVVTIHTHEWKRAKWGLLARSVLRLAELLAVHSAHLVVTVSDDLAEYLRRTYNVSAYVDAPPGPGGKIYPPETIRRKYGLSGNDYILYLGRFVPEKRIEWLIRAYKRLRPHSVRLVIAGGSGASPAYERTLRSMAQRDKGIMFPGWTFGREKGELLGNCLLFVLPSSVEGNPVVLQELPVKTPVLVSDLVARALKGGRPVHTFTHTNEEDMCRELKTILRVSGKIE